MEKNINADHNNDILLILAVLRGITRRWTTTSEIQNRLASQGLDIHRRTLQRVLKRIVNHPELGVELDDRTRVYAYRQTVPSGSFSAMQMNPQECLLLRLFEENMRYLLPGSLMNAMEPLFETARATLRERAPETPERTWLSKVASVPSGVKFIPPEIKPRIFDAVSEALYREVKLEVRYRNLEGVEKEAIVSPLGLVLQDRKVYVVVRFDGYDNCRHLALHRMLDAKLLEFAADVPEDFSLDEYMQSRHFNYSNGKKVRLVLEFEDGHTATLLDESPFSRDQKLEKLEDGFWRLEATTDDTSLLKGWIGGWPDGHFRLVEKIPMD